MIRNFSSKAVYFAAVLFAASACGSSGSNNASTSSSVLGKPNSELIMELEGDVVGNGDEEDQDLEFTCITAPNADSYINLSVSRMDDPNQAIMIFNYGTGILHAEVATRHVTPIGADENHQHVYTSEKHTLIIPIEPHLTARVGATYTGRLDDSEDMSCKLESASAK